MTKQHHYANMASVGGNPCLFLAVTRLMHTVGKIKMQNICMEEFFEDPKYYREFVLDTSICCIYCCNMLSNKNAFVVFGTIRMHKQNFASTAPLQSLHFDSHASAFIHVRSRLLFRKLVDQNQL
jgi:hypothetical protein